MSEPKTAWNAAFKMVVPVCMGKPGQLTAEHFFLPRLRLKGRVIVSIVAGIIVCPVAAEDKVWLY